MNEENQQPMSAEQYNPAEMTEQHQVPERPPFSAQPREVIGAGAMYVTAYFYMLMAEDWRWLPAAALLLVGMAELLLWERRRCRESFVWLGCFACACIGRLLPEGGLRVWDGAQLSLFIHGFFVYWVLCRGGVLAEGQSSHLLPLDMLNGFFILPFRHFFLRIRTLIWGAAHLIPRRNDGRSRPWGWIALAAAACLGLFVGAAKLLMQADAGFGDLLKDAAEWFSVDWDEVIWLRLLFSLPVGAWLFGLIGGARRTEETWLQRQRSGVYGALEKLRKVPGGFWTAVIALFSVLYLVFFAVQGQYLFGAFVRRLPEGFIVSEYARQGFFELCKVMAVNFAVLWLVTRMATPETAEKKSFTAACLVLLAESVLFAVIALSKLALYISCFGFTPLRLQSSWLVCVLLTGCGLWMYHLLTGRPAFRKWLIFGGVTLSVLCLL